MSIEKIKAKIIDYENKVIHLAENIDIHHGDCVINSSGQLLYIDFSGETPRMKFKDGHSYGEFTTYNMGQYAKIDVPIEDLDSDVFAIMMGKKSIDDFKEGSNDDSLDTSTQLVHLKSSDSLILAKSQMELKKNYVKALHNRLEGLLDNKRRQLYALVEDFSDKLEKINKVLYTIELYLGAKEDVVQLVEGEKASQDITICFRQKLLFMDEEVGIYEGGGIGFEDIEKFDNWISDNFKKVIPEEKSVTVFRVRRYRKEYGDSFSNDVKEPYDIKTYFLIRNGNNLYRIWANIIVHPRLFPLRNEINKIYEKLSSSSFKSDQKRADDTVLQYQRNSLVLQGIIDRTDIFSPIPEGINVFSPDSYGKTIQLIYDDENLLPDGRKSFNEWRKEINSQIERGSRVIYHFDWNEMQEKYIHERYFQWRRWYPGAPKDCMFTIEDVVSENTTYSLDKETLKVLFNPGGGWYDDRKKRVAFKLFKDDWFILNYDKISLEDIDFYINSRVDRHNYLKMLPVLIEAKKLRIEEMDWEKEFVKMTIGEFLKEGVAVKESDVWEAIDWWKNKVIWKRPITKDDSKALRMIKSKLKK